MAWRTASCARRVSQTQALGFQSTYIHFEPGCTLRRAQTRTDLRHRLLGLLLRELDKARRSDANDRQQFGTRNEGRRDRGNGRGALGSRRGGAGATSTRGGGCGSSGGAGARTGGARSRVGCELVSSQQRVVSSA